jgi:hypothetical protein
MAAVRLRDIRVHRSRQIETTIHYSIRLTAPRARSSTSPTS